MNTFASRRRFLLASSITTLGLGSVAAYTQYASDNTGSAKSAKQNLDTLSSIIDTILPAGVTSAQQQGALDLKIDDSIRHAADREPKFSALLERSTEGVDQAALTEHQRTFASLNIDQREVLLTNLLRRNTKRQLRRDLNALRNSVLLRYYASAAGRQHLVYTLPTDYPNY